MSDNHVITTLYCLDPSTTLDTINSRVNQLANGYFWHNASLVFFVSGDSLLADTNIGECLEDEYLILYIVDMLSVEYPCLVIDIRDSDGHFLLVEAADSLPSWVNPESVENRTFLHRGCLHLIPKPTNPAMLAIYPLTLTLQLALSLIVNPDIPTIASEDVQRDAFACIKEYPLKIHSNIQRVRCILPIDILHILHYAPHLITRATTAFYERDVDGIRSAGLMRKFNSQDRAESTIKFSRMGFAQIASQLFHAPKAYKMPSATQDTFSLYDIGMKLTCGFEILFWDKQLREQADVELINKPSLTTNDKFKKYIERLESFGYFKEEIKGSALYKTLLQSATDSFMASNIQPSTNTYLSVIDALAKPILSLSEITSDEAEDSLDYLSEAIDTDQPNTLNEDDFGLNDDLLSGTDKLDIENLASIISGFKGFMDGESGIDGVVMNNDRDGSDNDEDDHVESPGFNSDMFMQKMKQVLGMNESQSESDSDDEEEMVDIMESMDQELASTHIGHDFDDSDQKGKPVNLDVNMVKQLLASFEAQDGLSGPMNAIVASIGAKLPKLNSGK